MTPMTEKTVLPTQKLTFTVTQMKTVLLKIVKIPCLVKAKIEVLVNMRYPKWPN